MSDIYSLFDVCNNADIPNGFIVEDCMDYSDVLGDAVIYCREERKEDVVAWIEDNIKINVDYVINMFKSNPETCIQYLKKFLGITTFTDTFVDECGGIQNFLDKYCKVEIEEPVEEPIEELVEEPVEELVEEPIEEPIEEPVEELVEEPIEELVEEPIEEPIEESIEEDDPEDWVPESEPIIEEELEELITEPVVNEETSTEANYSEELSEQPKSMISAEDLKSIVGEMVSATSLNRDEAMLMRMQAEHMLRDVENKTRVLEQNYGTISKYFTPEGDFVGFNDEKRYIETLEALKNLDKRICMGSIDPSYVLDKVELSKAIDNLGNYSPAVFKMFILKLVTEADSERDRLRVSALLNDFAAFVEEGCKTW